MHDIVANELKNVLMITSAFPPINTSGAARPYYFAKYLSQYGYYPTVLAKAPNGETPVDGGWGKELDGQCKVEYVRELSVRRLLGYTREKAKRAAQASGPSGPQRETRRSRRGSIVDTLKRRVWRTGWWTLPLQVKGLQAISTGVDVIWATGDPWENLMAGYWLSRLAGKPLVVDMRDPWTYGILWKPESLEDRRWNEEWERRILQRARRIVFTSPLTTREMRRRYPTAAARMCTITNGMLEDDPSPKRTVDPSKCLFLFTGVLATHRDPRILLRAIRRACRDRRFAEHARIQFVGRMRQFGKDIREMGLDGIIQEVKQVPYEESRRYMRGADVLILLQTISGPGEDCVSGKAFEYLAAGKPILAVVPVEGGDAWLMRQTCGGVVCDFRDEMLVTMHLLILFYRWRQGRLPLPAARATLASFTRKATAGQLARVLDDVTCDGELMGAANG